ncbi:MAG TPA: F0F1 ATP synthase subunit delta [Candidatus Acidoferrum sp.]|nr:F0F1 ATP synthase subunit delta [Candidatus Acidoferrum sp.]
MAQLTTLARPYAKAAFGTAESSGQLAAWSKGLGLLAAVAQQPRVAAALSDPSRNTGLQAQTLIDLCGGELDAKVQNFVLVLAANKRLALLPQIIELFEQLKAERERTVDVDVVSAFPIDGAAEQQLAAALKQKLQRDVKLTASVDKDLIGGVVVRAGDTVIDNSVRGRLKKLAEAMNA